MGLDDATTEAQPVDADTAPAAASSNPPRDNAKRERAAKRQKIRRIENELKGAEDDDALWAKLQRAADKLGRRLPDREPAPAAPGLPEVSAVAAQVGPSNGWPTAEQSAAALPMALALWGKAATALHGTAFELGSTEVRVQTGSLPDGSPEFGVVKVDQVTILGQGWAPLIAQLGGGASEISPAASAAICTAMVFGPPALQLGFGALAAWWAGRDAAPEAEKP